MTIREKYDQYKSPHNPEAWDQYMLLSRKKKRKKRSIWLWLSGILTGLSVLLVYNIMHSTSHIDTTPNFISTPHQLVQNTNRQNDIAYNEYDQKMRLESSSDIENPSGTIINNDSSAKLSHPWSLTPDKRKSMQGKASPIDEVKLLLDIGDTQDADRPRLINSINVLTPLSITSLHVPLIHLAPPTLSELRTAMRKGHTELTNRISIYTYYAQSVVNGFALEQPVQKRGIGLRLSYDHNVTKLMSIGLQAGISMTKDSNNSDLDMPDKEHIRYLHAVLILYPVSEQNHKLTLSTGIGLTYTDRVLGAYRIENNVVSRITSHTQITSLDGIQASISYQARVYEKYWIGIKASHISHNDGDSGIGLILSYEF